jgi:hypothetical protein
MGIVMKYYTRFRLQCTVTARARLKVAAADIYRTAKADSVETIEALLPHTQQSPNSIPAARTLRDSICDPLSPITPELTLYPWRYR